MECGYKDLISILHIIIVFVDLLKLIESESVMPDTIKDKLNNMLTLLNKYTNNQKEIQHSMLALLDSSYVNILEAQQLSKKLDVIKDNSK